MTKFTVTDTALKAGEPWGHAPIHVELVDSTGAAVSPAYVDATGVLVEAFDTVADGDGVFTLTLDSTADISPTGCFYLVRIGDADNIISGDDGDGTVRGLRASTPTVLGSTATLSGLADVNISGRVDGSIVEWDATTSRWVMGAAGGGGGVSSVSGTAPITSTGGATPAIGITAATSGAAGSMSAADKSKLDGIEAGATADQSAAELLTAIKTVDGTGSGLDADTVDGQHASAFEAAGTAAALVDDLSGVTNAATARTNLGLGGLATLSAVGASQITDGSITNDEINASAAIALSKLASISTARILGRTTSGSGAIEELSQASVFGFLGTGTPSGTTYLRGDGTWSTPAGGGSVATDAIFDAKGDLAVGTGADTASKLTVGADSKVLTADSTQATGAKWDYAVPPFGNPKNGATTYYVTPGFLPTNISTLSLSANRRYFFLFWTPTAITVDQIAIEQTTAAAAGKLFRIGLIAADEYWQPTGSALIESGTFAADGANGVKTYTPGAAVLLPPGRYLGSVHSDGGPVIRVMTGGSVATSYPTTLGGNLNYNHNVSTALAAVDSTAWDTVSPATAERCGMWLRLSDPTS